MTKRRIALLLAVPLTLAFSACDSGDGEGANGANGGNGENNANDADANGDNATEERFTTQLELGTGSGSDEETGEISAPIGEQLPEIFEANVNADDFSVGVVESENSVQNVASIEMGQLQLGLANNQAAVDAVEGAGSFDGVPLQNIALIGQLYPEEMHLVTVEGSGIESVEDLTDATVSVGPLGSAKRTVAEELLAAGGIDVETDVETLEAEGDEPFPDPFEELQAGNIDAAIEFMSVPSERLANLEGAQIVPVDSGQLGEVASATAAQESEIPADAYDVIDEPVETVSVVTGLYGSTTEIDEEVGYQITQALYDNLDQLEDTPENMLDVDRALEGQGDLPLHPGAQRFFAEVGVD